MINAFACERDAQSPRVTSSSSSRCLEDATPGSEAVEAVRVHAELTPVAATVTGASFAESVQSVVKTKRPIAAVARLRARPC